MVLVFAESVKGQFKKAAFEAVTYGYKTAQLLGIDCAALCLGTAENAGQLGKYGATKGYQAGDAALDAFDSQVYAAVISAAAEKLSAKVVVMSHTSTGRALLGRIAARLDAGSVAGANALPDTAKGFTLTKSVYSGKAIATYELRSGVKVISRRGNEIPPEEVAGDVTPEALDVTIPERKIKVLEVKRQEGIVPLPEAELVVSAGRGMKGPENWGIIEDLAKAMGATTACSRPVPDAAGRPPQDHGRLPDATFLVQDRDAVVGAPGDVGWLGPTSKWCHSGRRTHGNGGSESPTCPGACDRRRIRPTRLR